MQGPYSYTLLSRTDNITFAPIQVAGAVKDLVERLEGVRAGGTRALTPKEELVLRLNEQYPLDVGVLSAFFLNLVTLKAGQVPSEFPIFMQSSF